MHSLLQFLHRRVVVVLRHVRAGQASMSLLPLRMLPVEFFHLCDGSVIVALIAIRISEVVPNRGLARRQFLCQSVFRDRLWQVSLFMTDQTEVGMRLPEHGPQLEGAFVRLD